MAAKEVVLHRSGGPLGQGIAQRQRRSSPLHAGAGQQRDFGEDAAQTGQQRRELLNHSGSEVRFASLRFRCQTADTVLEPRKVIAVHGGDQVIDELAERGWHERTS
ncbi:hypothetical protein [Streptomyces virginiae]|uniref:Uncharacterized protein n=1 Tax=Streptomyces virginiae TaxID=1961 RepID=A0ABZ1T2M1_STRVG|nr:hypothetical protein [Streptomyces virginiae]